MVPPESLQWAEQCYQTYSDFWQVNTNPLRMVRDRVILDLVQGLHFRSVVDFACGFGVIAQALASQADCVTGIDGAPTAIAMARQASAGLENLSFLEGSWQELRSMLEMQQPDLLVNTDSWSFFTREQQRGLLDMAATHGVTYCLLEVRIADRETKRDVTFLEGVDFETPSSLEAFLDATAYCVVRKAVSRLYTAREATRRAAYSEAAYRRALRAKRWLIDVPTALLGTRERVLCPRFYDARVLYRRLRWCSRWYRMQALRPLIEPVVGGLALLLRLKSG